MPEDNNLRRAMDAVDRDVAAEMRKAEYAKSDYAQTIKPRDTIQQSFMEMAPTEVDMILSASKAQLTRLHEKRDRVAQEIERLSTVLNDTVIAIDCIRAAMNNAPPRTEPGYGAGAGIPARPVPQQSIY